jgi:hypothetical protein
MIRIDKRQRHIRLNSSQALPFVCSSTSMPTCDSHHSKLSLLLLGVAMGIVVPKVGHHLWADTLLRSVQDVLCQIPDPHRGIEIATVIGIRVASTGLGRMASSSRIGATYDHHVFVPMGG